MRPIKRWVVGASMLELYEVPDPGGVRPRMRMVLTVIPRVPFVASYSSGTIGQALDDGDAWELETTYRQAGGPFDWGLPSESEMRRWMRENAKESA